MPHGHERKAFRRPHMPAVELQQLKCNVLHHMAPALMAGERRLPGSSSVETGSGVAHPCL